MQIGWLTMLILGVLFENHFLNDSSLAVILSLRAVSLGRVINLEIRNPNGIDKRRRDEIVRGNTISNKSWFGVSSSLQGRGKSVKFLAIVSLSILTILIFVLLKYVEFEALVALLSHLNLSKLSCTGKILKIAIGQSKITFKIMSKVENKLINPKLDTGVHGHKKLKKSGFTSSQRANCRYTQHPSRQVKTIKIVSYLQQ